MRSDSSTASSDGHRSQVRHRFATGRAGGGRASWDPGHAGAAAELAGIPDTPELRASDAAPPTGPNSSETKDRLDRKIARIADSMVERFGRGEEPVDLANASLGELLAFVTAFGPAAQGAFRSVYAI